MNALSNVATFITIGGLIYTIVVVFLWEKVIKRAYYRIKYRRLKGTNAYALIITSKKNLEDAKAKIKIQRESLLPQLKGLRIETIILPEKCSDNTPRELITNIECMRDSMAKEGKVDVHLFYGGPGALAAVIGGYFYNKGAVYIYQHNDKGEYECWGPIKP